MARRVVKALTIGTKTSVTIAFAVFRGLRIVEAEVVFPFLLISSSSYLSFSFSFSVFIFSLKNVEDGGEVAGSAEVSSGDDVSGDRANAKAQTWRWTRAAMADGWLPNLVKRGSGG